MGRASAGRCVWWGWCGVTVIQQVLFELDGDYAGHPYFVTGHALYNAVARRVDADVRRALHVSHGVFVPGEYGEYPERHSRAGYAGKLGLSLPDVAAYEDLFVFRDPAQRWLLDSRPRDAHNTHDLVSHGGRVAFTGSVQFARPVAMRAHTRTMSWYLHCYVHTDGDDTVLPLAEATLDGIRVGGARNYGFGELSVADTQLVDLDALDYSGVVGASDGYRVEVVSPYVLETASPHGDGQAVPWWWDVPSDVTGGLRRRASCLVDGGDTYPVELIDHGQVVEYAGDDPVGTAVNGVLRVGTHSRFGFGELRVRPAGTDRVPERIEDVTGGGG
jgi:hypothetical protein